MSKYIDAEKLKSEITRIYNEHPGHISERYEDGVDDGYLGCCDEIVAVIDSLQQEQPEVDLEEEYKTWWNSISGKINIEHMMEWYMHETARHFYELGLKAKED